ncbi:hypothetical protein ACFOTA_19110 [Chitinophaga sp. GCM10012297]|uniref:Por secretion system C-terminal sorting domain-containing protein n=1 Tax=Chitinophaga chungangae TaxID=2821488 RepID=A0ABS3YI06_9BACT|nr:hypothetical protein [Chitinophaga chungangae]MBO9154332.1 hypothetical protein [Chitinophaga chungangae]
MSVTDMQQLPSAKGHVRIQVPALAFEQGTVQCTIYDAGQMPVRMIPLEAGHERGVYTLQLATLPPGKYTVQVKERQLEVKLEH